MPRRRKALDRVVVEGDLPGRSVAGLDVERDQDLAVARRVEPLRDGAPEPRAGSLVDPPDGIAGRVRPDAGESGRILGQPRRGPDRRRPTAQVARAAAWRPSEDGRGTSASGAAPPRPRGGRPGRRRRADRPEREDAARVPPRRGSGGSRVRTERASRRSAARRCRARSRRGRAPGRRRPPSPRHRPAARRAAGALRFQTSIVSGISSPHVGPVRREAAAVGHVAEPVAGPDLADRLEQQGDEPEDNHDRHVERRAGERSARAPRAPDPSLRRLADPGNRRNRHRLEDRAERRIGARATQAPVEIDDEPMGEDGRRPPL